MAWASVEEAVEARAEGDLARASTLLEAEIERVPRATTWIELAVTRSWAADLQGAQDAYEQALALDPSATTAAVGHARVTAWRGRRGQAQRTLEALAPHDEEALTELGRVQLARRRVGAARATFLAAQDRDGLREVQRTRRGRVDLDGAFGTTRLARAGLAYEATGTTTLRAGVRTGFSPDVPLAARWSASAGATWTNGRSWWTPAVTWEGRPWLGLSVAQRVAGCVPELSTSSDGRAVRGRAALQCGRRLQARADLHVGIADTLAWAVVGGVRWEGPVGIRLQGVVGGVPGVRGELELERWWTDTAIRLSGWGGTAARAGAGIGFGASRRFR